MHESELKSNIKMRKFRNLKLTEKLLLILAIVLIGALVFKLPRVKEGFLNGCERLGITLFTNK